MEIYRTERTEETPTIILNPDSRIFLFAETSWPENAQAFYAPTLEWLKNFFESDTSDSPVSIRFKFSYFNSASAKQIAKILSLLKQYSGQANMRIEWFYEEDDFDMKREGMRFKKILNLDMAITSK